MHDEIFHFEMFKNFMEVLKYFKIPSLKLYLKLDSTKFELQYAKSRFEIEPS